MLSSDLPNPGGGRYWTIRENAISDVEVLLKDKRGYIVARASTRTTNPKVNLLWDLCIDLIDEADAKVNMLGDYKYDDEEGAEVNGL